MAFENLVGQNSVKKKLDFYIEAYEQTSVVPFLLFVGAKGLGKTEFAREFSNNLKYSEGIKRPFVEINSSTIKGAGAFFEQIFLPYILDRDVTILFDEAHALPRDLTMSFLTIFNTENSTTKDFLFKDSNYTFDFTRQTFLFATTESDKIFAPLRDRLVTIDFDNYSNEDLAQIFLNRLPEVSFEEEAVNTIASTFRGNARNCIHKVRDVGFYCKTKNICKFTSKHTKDLFNTLSILPEGLTNIEWRILNILRTEGRCSLQTLSAKTGLSRSAIQRDHENYLLQKGYMDIDGQRLLTKRGHELVYKHI